MVQEISLTSCIPDELYNLTKLAEVTLAAGKLNTTNSQQIKNYIHFTETNHKNFYTEKDYYTYSSPYYICKDIDSKHQTNWNSYCNISAENLDDYSSDSRKSSEQKKNQSVLERDIEVDKLKINFYNNYNEASTHSVIKFDTKNINDEIQIIKETESKLLIQRDTSSSRSITSSDEEESIYNYSHKIFDRKKKRSVVPFKNVKEIKTTKIANDEKTDDSNDYESQDCDHCSSTLCVKIDRADNSSSGLDESHICPECGKKYSTSSNLARHRQTHRSLQDKKARRCPHCDKVYVSMPAFSMHVRTHNQGCQCPHCGKCFSRPWLLQGHLRTHTGEKPFKCNLCSKAFADKSNLRAHIQTHNTFKPHSCNRCGKAFALKSYLYKHEESSCMRNHKKTDKSSHDIKQKMKHNKKTEKTIKLSNNNVDNYNKPNQSEHISTFKEQTNLSIEKNQNLYRNTVIRSAKTINLPIENKTINFTGDFSQHQEKPVDFSPNNKFQINSNYAIIA